MTGTVIRTISIIYNKVSINRLEVNVNMKVYTELFKTSRKRLNYVMKICKTCHLEKDPLQ